MMLEKGSGAGMVKSAKRVLEIFEYIASNSQPITIEDVAKTLGYPRSSTSVLLRTLCELRYLQPGAKRGMYLPTLRLSLIGTRIRNERLSGIELTQMMLEAEREAGANVILGTENGLYARYIQFVPSARLDFPMRIGALRPIGRCAIGRALLLHRSEAEIAKLVRRINHTDEPDAHVNLRQLLGELEDARKTGVAFSDNSAIVGSAGLAVELPPGTSELPLALGVAGPRAFIVKNRERLTEMLLQKAGEVSKLGRRALPRNIQALPS